jgi:hypothetical protein
MKIARHCGVSKSTVENYRNSLSVHFGQINPERIATRNGKPYTMNTANIGGRWRLRYGTSMHPNAAMKILHDTAV